MKPKSHPKDQSEVSHLLAEIQSAGKAVNEAADHFANIQASLRKLGLQAETEGTTTEHVAIEVLTDGAYPLPVGSQGTTIIKNDTNTTVTLKTGMDAPIAFPGTVMISIPPGQSAAIQKIQPNAPELQTQVVKWKNFDPCIPPVPGVICVQPPEWTRNVNVGANDSAVPVKTGWVAERTVGVDSSSGLTLT